MKINKIIKEELHRQSEAIRLAAERTGEEFDQAVELIFNCQGKIVVTGMGKTGLIGRKIAATLSSTGTSAFYLHPAEGIHGDLGMVQEGDLLIALSYSGNTREMIEIIPYMHFHKIPIIAITGNHESELAKNSCIVLNSAVPKEYEPFGLVPTSSTTVSLAIGDALAVALLRKRSFCEEDFARYHPGGTIGRRLLLKVDDLMHTNDEIPYIDAKDGLDKVVLEMTSKKLGCTCVMKENRLIGIITDGDLRRLLALGMKALKSKAEDIMTKDPLSISRDKLAVDALYLMEKKKITMLPVLESNNQVAGILHMHDLIQAGVVG